ncbi:hypothetical protein DFH09DRAFT_1110044 [Mycena vulgaris]|nr:hypothetical protein DFH09DRAFT_1110044 [Mycena vulgaris]
MYLELEGSVRHCKLSTSLRHPFGRYQYCIPRAGFKMVSSGQDQGLVIIPTLFRVVSSLGSNMTVCNGCSIDFYGLADDTCHKCKELAGKSEPEKVSIRCTASFRLCCVTVVAKFTASLHILDSPIRAHVPCLANGDSVPKQIFQLPGANEQLVSFKTSDLTSKLLETAQESWYRIRTQKAAPGISKGAMLVQEMQEKREQGKKIKFTIILCKEVVKANKSIGIIAIPNMRPVENILEETPVYQALDHITLRVEEFHAKAFPMAAKIRRQMITFYASETVTKYFNIPKDNLTDGTVSDLLLYLKLNRHVTDAQFETKQVQLELPVVFAV